MKLTEKKTYTYGPNSTIQKQLKDLEDTLYKSFNLPNTRRRVIGQYMGKDVYEGDIMYDPASQTYKINLGDGSAATIDPKNFMYTNDPIIPYKRVERVKRIADLNVLVISYTDGTEERFDLTVCSGADNIQVGMSRDDVYRALTGATTGTLSQDPLRARVEAGTWRIDGLGASVRPAGDWSVRITDKNAEIDQKAFDKLKANSVYGNSVGTASQRITGTKTYKDSAKLAGSWSGLADYRKPWDDPLKDQIDRASNTVACIDMPEPRPDYDPNTKPKIYYHDRFPSIPVREIVNDAILMLRAKKQLNISIHSFSKEGDDYRLIYKVIVDNVAPDLKQGKLIECVLTKKAFDRISSEVDRYAGLKAKLDTDTFLKLRIAYLLYKAQKVSCDDAKKIILDIFRVIGSSSHAIFDYR